MHEAIDKRGLRKLLDTLFKNASDLDAFIIDNFEVVHHRAVCDADRVAKVNRLLTEVPVSDLFDAIRKHDASSLQKLLRADERYTELLSNPFHQWGTLPANSKSYVRRKCDSQLSAIIRSKCRVSLFGQTQIGKSSLLKQVESDCSNYLAISYISFEDMITHDCSLFHERFFRRLGRRFRADIIDWESLSELASQQPFVLFIDELGLLRDPMTTEQFIPRLLHFCDLHALALVVAMPVSIDHYFSEVRIDNPKYRSGWQSIELPCFDDLEVLQLLELLPGRARELAKKNIHRIIASSKRSPQSIQKLCHLLYDADESGLAISEMQRAIESLQSY